MLKRKLTFQVKKCARFKQLKILFEINNIIHPFVKGHSFCVSLLLYILLKIFLLSLFFLFFFFSFFFLLEARFHYTVQDSLELRAILLPVSWMLELQMYTITPGKIWYFKASDFWISKVLLKAVVQFFFLKCIPWYLLHFSTMLVSIFHIVCAIC